MKLRTIALAALVIAAFLTTTGFLSWYLFGGEARTRAALLDYLHSHINQSFQIGRISPQFRGFNLWNVSFELSPSVNLSVEQVRIKTFLPSLILSRAGKAGVIKEIEMVSPRLSILRSTADSTGSPGFSYQPFPFKRLGGLEIVQRIMVDNAVVTLGATGHVLVDSITGNANFSEISNVILTMEGKIRRLPEARFEINGFADLIGGGFIVGAQALISDLGGWTPPEELKSLKFNRGDLSIQLEIRGADDLRITGRVSGENISGIFRDKVSLSDGSMKGELFGNTLDMNGMFTVNGLPLPFELEVEDLLKPVWRVEIPRTVLDLERLDGEKLCLPELKGLPVISAVISGDGDVWGGHAALSGGEIDVARLKLDEFAVDAEYGAGAVIIGKCDARIFGGAMKLDGRIGLFSDSTDLSFVYNREWTKSDGPDVPGGKPALLSMAGGLRRHGGVWRGLGACELRDSGGQRQLTGKYDLYGNDVNITVTSPQRIGRISLTVEDIGDSTALKLSAKDPHRLLDSVLDDRYLPVFLDDYSLGLTADGSWDRFRYRVTWESLSSRRNGSYRGLVVHEGRTWRADGDLRLKTGEGDLIGGGIKAQYDAERLMVKSVNLFDVATGRSFLNGHFTLTRPVAHHAGAGRHPRFQVQEFACDADSLPLLDLVRFIIPDAAEGFGGSLGLSCMGRNDSLQWRGELCLDYPDSLILKLTTDGRYEDGRVRFDKFTVLDSLEAVKLLNLNGALDLKQSTFDSLVLSFNGFPAASALRLVLPRYAERFKGNINARIEADGPFGHPDISADLHLTSVIVQGAPGYWMNLRSVTEGDRYILEQFNIGRDVRGLFDITGQMNRISRRYDFQLTGTGVEIGSLFETLTGNPSPVSGQADIDVNLSGTGKPNPEVNARLSISPGRIGPLRYDSLHGDFRISGVDEGRSFLELDSVVIDWGDVAGGFSGEVLLSRKGAIDVSGSIRGRLLGLLPRLTGFFSEPRGDGELYLKIGGDLSHPRLTEGRFRLSDGSLRLKNVVRKIDDLQVDVELDTNGVIQINELEGSGNGRPFYFSNRRPLHHEEAIVVGDYDFGILQFATVREGIWAVIPSLMRPDWGGYLWFSGAGGRGPFEFHGPAARPLGTGEIRLLRSTLTYPFLTGGGKPSPFVRSLLGLLKRMRWDGRVIPYQVCRYDREISGFGKSDRQLMANTLLNVDVKAYVDLVIDDNPEGLYFSGSLQDTLHLRGELTSSKGSVEYLDLSFDVDKIGVVFNPWELEPIFYGGVRTNVIDTTGMMREIRWVIRKTGQEPALDASQKGQHYGQDRGRWNEISFVFEDDQHHSQEQILAMLGFSPEMLPDKLVDIGGKLIADVTPIRRWTRSLERQVERWLGVDRVYIDNRIAQNYLTERWITENDTGSENSSNYHYLRSLDHSRLTVGKYLSRDIYLSYTGSLLSSTDAYYVTRIGVVHSWDLLLRLYRISPNLILNYRYEYDSLTKVDDSRIFFRFSYTFK